MTEVWDNFFANDAPYNFDDAGDELGIEIMTRTEWLDTDDRVGKQVALKKELVKMRVHIDSNPFADYLDSVRTSHLLELTPTSLIIEVDNDGYDHIYSDRYVSKWRWEVYQPIADSEKSVLRQIFKFSWINKPMFIADRIEQEAIKMIKSHTSYTLDIYMREKIEEYLKVKTGEMDEAFLELTVRPQRLSSDSFDISLFDASTDKTVWNLSILFAIISAILLNTCVFCCFCPFVYNLKKKRDKRLELKAEADQIVADRNKDEKADV